MSPPWPLAGPAPGADRPSRPLSGAVAQPRARSARVLRPLAAGPCPSVVRHAGHRACALAPRACPRRRAWTAALMMPPCTRPDVISKALITTATVPGPPGRTRARGGASPSSGRSCASPDHAGLATPCACPWASHALAKQGARTTARCARAAPGHGDPPHPRPPRGDRWRRGDPGLLTCPAPQRRGGRTVLPHGHTLAPAPHMGQRPARGAAPPRCPDRRAHTLGHACASVAPSPAGSGDLPLILGGERAPRRPRTAPAGRGGLATAPPGHQSAQPPHGLGASQAPGSFVQHRCGAVCPRHGGDVGRSLGHSNGSP